MKKILVMLIIGALTFGCYAGATPRQTAQNFINAMKYGNVNLALKEISNGENAHPDPDTLFLMVALFKDARIVEVESAGYNKAIVYIRLTNPVTDTRETVPFTLCKSGGEWKIEIK